MDLAQARTEFLAYVAVERGLSVNTLDAYTRDLEGYLLWLGKVIFLPLNQRIALTKTTKTNKR